MRGLLPIAAVMLLGTVSFLAPCAAGEGGDAGFPHRMHFGGFGEGPGTPLAPSLPGWSLRLGALSRQAVEGETETVVTALREPNHGWGIFVTWTRIWNEAIPRGASLAAGPILAAGPWRLTVRWSRWTWGAHRRSRLASAVHRRLGEAFLVGGCLEVSPSGEAGAAEAGVFEAIAAAAPWRGMVRLGPRPGTWALGFGVEARPGVFCDLMYGDETLEIGVAWSFGSFEGAARERDHDLLGRVSRVHLAVGGGAR